MTDGDAAASIGAIRVESSREEALERRRRWLASPRGRLHAVLAVLGCSALLCGTAIAMLAVALVTLFRWRRGYTEWMARWMSEALLRIVGVTVVLHRGRPFPQAQTIYVANHTSTLDPFILLSLGLPNTRYFLRAKYLAVIPLGIICKLTGAFLTPPQSRPAARVRCFQAAERVLRRTGDSVYLSPEGTRITGGTIGHFNKGTFHLATDLRVPIVPLFIDIPPEINPGRGFGAMPGTVHVHVLPAISTDGWRIEDVLENAEKVRGVYVTFQDALRPAGSAGALPPRERASARSGSRP